jgi:putative transferase (TIGR04331 family)
MFLITTADQRFWKTEDKVLFLGEWCKPYTARKSWCRMNYEVLPYHWENRQRFAEDKRYLDLLYEKYLKSLSLTLNEIHAVQYSHKYWRILIGTWLRGFMETLFDRYSSIKAAGETGKVTGTWICSTKAWVPKSEPDYSEDDACNQYLYSRIIKKLGVIPHIEKQHPNPSENQTAVAFSKRVKNKFATDPFNLLRPFVRRLYSHLPSGLDPKVLSWLNPSIVFCGNIYLSSWDRIRLQIRSGSPPLIYQGKPFLPGSGLPSVADRNRLVVAKSDDVFEQLLNELLPEQLPMVYLEHYRKMQEHVLDCSPRAPKVIFTAYANTNRSCFEFYAAYCREEYGTRICFMQHGGGYGSARYANLDEHAIKAFDWYYTWGSPLDGSPNVKKMPSLRLQTSKKQIKDSRPRGAILWIAHRDLRYQVALETGVSGQRMKDYLEEQQRFFDCLSPNAQNLVTRRYFGDHCGEMSLFSDKYPRLKLQIGQYGYFNQNVDFPQQVEKSRLVVLPANETAYLETLVANIPTIVYWNPKYFEIRESQEAFFKVLSEAGILHYSPESAASMINEIYGRPKDWWEKAGTQNARRIFCDNLAYTSDDWLETWGSELKRVAFAESR